jgi:hypothetical protein
MVSPNDVEGRREELRELIASRKIGQAQKRLIGHDPGRAGSDHQGGLSHEGEEEINGCWSG